MPTASRSVFITIILIITTTQHHTTPHHTEPHSGKLLVDVLNVKGYAKQVMLDVLPAECDLLCTHPMFGPESAPVSWQSKPFVYEQVRVTDYSRMADFLKMFEAER